MNAAELDAIRFRVEGFAAPTVPGTAPSDRAVLLAELDRQWRARESLDDKLYDVRVVLGQAEDAIAGDGDGEDCPACAGICCSPTAAQALDDAMLQIRKIVGAR